MADEPYNMDPEMARQDMQMAHSVIATCYAKGHDPLDVAYRNLRVYGSILAILGSDKECADHLRRLANHLDPQGGVEVADSLLDAALKRS